MGMGYAAAYADTIEEEFIEDIVPSELANFKSALEKEKVSLEEFANSLNDGDYDAGIYQTFNQLKLVFNAITGLELNLNFHDVEERGGRYDDVDGTFWSVEGVYEMSEAGKKYHDKINRSYYVIFG